MHNNKHIRVIIAGGGTGGHIFPAVAIANAIKRRQPQATILFVGALGRMEMDKVPKEGYEIVGLPIAGFQRGSILKNISLPYKLIKSLFMARKIVKDFAPDVVVGVGGYASFPVLHAAQKMKVPTLIQEQNSHAGKSNMRLAVRASKICVAYDGMEKYFAKEKIVYTGNPVRASIAAQKIDRSDACNHFGLDASKKIILVIGGSLGAKKINDTIAAQHEQLLAQGAQVLWQTGQAHFEIAKQSAVGKESDMKVVPFIQEMNMAYAAADIVVSRAGALSIAELCIVAKPVVFVPYPYAAEDHQTVNARSLVSKHAAMMVADKDAPQALVPQVIALLQNEEEQREQRKQLQALAIANADERIVDEIENLKTTA